MVNIDLTPQQIEELKKYYESELEQMRMRTDEFQRLLIKLDTKYSFGSKPATKSDKDEIKTVLTKQTSKKTSKIKPRKTKKPNWRNFILKSLKEQDKPLTSEEIFKSYQKQYDIDLSSSKNSVMALSQALRRLRVNDKIIQSTRIKGKREKLYGLINPADKSIILTKTAKAKKPVQLNKVNQKPKAIINLDKRPPLTSAYHWTKFINDTLKKTKRVLSVKDFVKYAMVYYNIPKQDRNSTRLKLSPRLSRLVNVVKTLKTSKKEGQPGLFYGFSKWFDGDKKLKVEYK